MTQREVMRNHFILMTIISLLKTYPSIATYQNTYIISLICEAKIVLLLKILSIIGKMGLNVNIPRISLILKKQYCLVELQALLHFHFPCKEISTTIKKTFVACHFQNSVSKKNTIQKAIPSHCVCQQ